MKIAQLVSNYHTTAPYSNQAIYSHVAWLTDSLVKRGHDVSLFASGNSETKGKLEYVTEKPTTKMNLPEKTINHYLNFLISRCYSQSSQFDVIHSHFNLLSCFYSKLVKTPTVHSIHSPITDRIKPFLLNFKTNRFISFSLAQRKAMPELNWIGNIYHGVDTNIFSYNPNPKDYLLYIGRITKEKGVHLAIKAAKAAGEKLIIAGRSYPEEGYWHEHIEKHIDEKNIKYVGEADFKDKIKLYQNAKALLFPTQYKEVFGYAMIEAMAAGTPVIGWKKGSVPEIVADKKTGFVVKSTKEMIEAVKNIKKISREATRKRAELYFSLDKMVSGYEKIYQRVAEEEEYKTNGKG